MKKLVIVTTVDKDGSVLAFSCNLAHHTAQNILEQHEFAVNVAGENIVEKAMETAKDYPREINELEKAGFQAIPSSDIKPLSIAECPVKLKNHIHSIRRAKSLNLAKFLLFYGIHRTYFQGRILADKRFHAKRAAEPKNP